MSLQRIAASGFLFDLDGVLADSSLEIEDHWRQFAKWYELDGEELVSTTHGVRDEDTIRRVLSDRSQDVIDEAIDRFRRLEVEDTERTVEVPGASVLLKSLPTSQVCLVTSCTKELAKARLTAVGIEMPKFQVLSEDVTKGKPDPQPYLYGARTLGVDPANCVVFEDAESGLQAGLSAGATVIGVATTQSAECVKEQLGTGGLVVNNLSDISVEEHNGSTVLTVNTVD